MHYKHSPARLAQIGRELNVQYVLEGSVRRDAEKVRVSAQLIRVKDETHTWAREYDRQLTGLLTVQAEIAREISGEIQVAFGDHKPAPHVPRPALSPEQSEAYDLYLKGLYHWNKRSSEGFRRAIGYFEQAIAKDPNHAPSYAGLADCYALLGGYTGEPLAEYTAKARTAALRALALDKNLPEAHTALAVIVQNYDHDWQTAGNEYRHAIELNPSYAMAHHWYSEHLGFLGRFDEALRESEIARQLDPLSLIIARDNGMLLIYARQFDRAIEKCRSVLDMDSDFGMGQDCLFRAYEAKGMFAQALATRETARRIYIDQSWLWAQLTYLYGRSGQHQQARLALEKLNRFFRPRQTDPAVFVEAYIGLGDKEQALAWLEKAYDRHSNTMATLKVNPIYDPLRGDPRFRDLLRRVEFNAQ
jgi:tetratricopeptide (TPR) repeat protein